MRRPSQTLHEIEARHKDRILDPCGYPWPCDALRAAQQVRDLVDLIHEHGSDELIAMADELVGGEGKE